MLNLKQISMFEIVLPYSEIVLCEEHNEGCFNVADYAHFEDLPPFYRVVFQSRPEKNSFIVSEVWLPKNWNGIFIGLGNGGMAGGIVYSGLAGYLRLGYAVANTDMGTSRGMESGINNPAVWKDFGWRATYLMTVCAKEIIKNHYGEMPKYSYFIGYSTGGQQALMLAQRFPKEYDGIIAGVHANNRTHLHTYFLWNHVCAHNSEGEPLFSPEDVLLINECAVKFHQLRGDGNKGDDFVTLPVFTESDIMQFVDFIADEISAFTDEQLNALAKMYKGPVNSVNGKQIYNGMPIGSEIFHCGIVDAIKEYVPHYYPFQWVFGKDFKPTQFDFNKDMDKLDEALAADMNANDPDLSEFYKNGGKLIAISGSADSCVPYPDALKYFARVKACVGSEITASFYKYYMLPGKEHGNNGKGTNDFWQTPEGGNVLEALRSWREEKNEPDLMYAIGYYNATPGEGIKFKRSVFPVDSTRTNVFSAHTKTMLLCDDEYLNR